MAKAALPAFAWRQFFDCKEASDLDGNDDELCDAVAAVHRVRLTRVGVKEHDLDLTAKS